MNALARIGKEAKVRMRLPAASFAEVQQLDPVDEESWIGLEIDARKLYQLLRCGAVRVADFRCLDRTAKCRVRHLCLRACAQRLHEHDIVETTSPNHAKRLL
jgi:hypothetical protein